MTTNLHQVDATPFDKLSVGGAEIRHSILSTRDRIGHCGFFPLDVHWPLGYCQ